MRAARILTSGRDPGLSQPFRPRALSIPCYFWVAVLFSYRSILSVPAETVFSWHERPQALLALMPSRRLMRLENQSGGLHDGGLVTLSIGIGPLRVRWKARHFGYIRNQQFCDEQISGPFALWRHTHRFEALGANASAYEDRVDCALPGGALLNRLAEPLLRRSLTWLFARRHAIVRASLEPSS